MKGPASWNSFPDKETTWDRLYALHTGAPHKETVIMQSWMSLELWESRNCHLHSRCGSMPFKRTLGPFLIPFGNYGH